MSKTETQTKGKKWGKVSLIWTVFTSSLKTPRYRKAAYKWTGAEVSRAYRRMIRAGGDLCYIAATCQYVNISPKRRGYVIGPHFPWVWIKKKKFEATRVIFLDIPDIELEKEMGKISDRLFFGSEKEGDVERFNEVYAKTVVYPDDDFKL